ncbi:hypothetical protein CRUP_031947 [Coryphaenoides rupestris]|nr:hypothetical protein CRUP_031947 [Coryphaenoides rupestris]
MGEGEGEEEEEGEGDTSSESASDEEMELYLHRLRAAPRPQNLRSFTRDGASGKGSQTGKRPSIDRAKLLPSSMPPISEAEHEEQLTSRPDTPEEMDDGSGRSLRRVTAEPNHRRTTATAAGGDSAAMEDRTDNVEATAGDGEENPPEEEEEEQEESSSSRRQQQEKLSGVVKNVHRKLRRKYKEVGDFEKIWREHCQDERTLSEYALAMKNLADHHWANKCEGEGRIEWCRSVCQEYFLDGGMKRLLEKDEKNSRLAAVPPGAQPSVPAPAPAPSSVPHRGKMRLLDVGSCFNPFLEFDEFLTVGIDISVYKCDFLNLQLQQPLQLAGDAVDAFLRQLRSPIDALPAQIFHVAVFSLLLSYFPSPYQRWLCCKKAHELLALHGLLLIITPDSSHQNRHALMMRSWRVAVESLGFRRCRYVKFAHMHLLAFRKVSLATGSDLVTRNYAEMLYIPQDFHGNEEEEDEEGQGAEPAPPRSDLEDDQLAWGFAELPRCPATRTHQATARAARCRASMSWKTPSCCRARLG